MTGADLLAEFLATTKLNQSALASKLRVSRPIVSMWLARRRYPGRSNALALEKLSAGAIPARAWNKSPVRSNRRRSSRNAS